MNQGAKAGTSGSDLELGLVTRLCERYYYVWNAAMGTGELRFLNVGGSSSLGFKEYSKRQAQPLTNLHKEAYQLEISPCRAKGVSYKIKTHIVFPPADYTGYAKIVTSVDNCVAMAFSPLFLKVACFDARGRDLQHRPGGVYEAYICRIPMDSNHVIEEVDTIFCLVGGAKSLTEVTDEVLVRNAQRAAPWHVPDDEALDDDGSIDGDDAGYDVDDVDEAGVVGDDEVWGGRVRKRAMKPLVHLPVKKTTPSTSPPPTRPTTSASSLTRGHSHRGYRAPTTTCSSSQSSEDEPSFRRTHTALANNSEDQHSIDIPQRQKTPTMQVKEDPLNQSGSIMGDTSKNLSAGSGGGLLGDKATTSTEVSRLGIVVRIERRYSVIWNSDDDLVIAVGMGTEKFDLATWVRYKSVDAEPGTEGFTKQAMEVVEVDPPRLSAKSYSSVKVQAFVKLHRRLKFNQSGYALVQDDLLKFVHVPNDEDLRQRLEDGQVAEVYVVFMEHYMKPSHWIAAYMNTGGEGAAENWRELTGLNERVKEQTKLAYKPTPNVSDLKKMQEAFPENPSRPQARKTTGLHELDPNVVATLPYWAPPLDYTGPVRETKKTYSQVLGLVVTYEEPGNRVSVIYTSFGLARLEKKLMVGTWLRMTIYEDDPEIQLQQRATTADRMGTHYLVRKWEKIKPPMSTRVVEVQNSEERLLLFGKVACAGGDNCWENDYLGKIDDEEGHIKRSKDSGAICMVEMCLFRNKRSYGGLCWRVLKFHGLAVPGINSLPLHLSMKPDDMGRTCDDPHTMMREDELNDSKGSHDKMSVAPSTKNHGS